MKKEFKKKLSLNKQTIEKLNNDLLNGIKGGDEAGTIDDLCHLQPSDGGGGPCQTLHTCGAICLGASRAASCPGFCQ